MHYTINGARSIKTIIEKRLIDPTSLKRLDNHLKTLPQTKDLFSNGSCYKPERVILHDRIIADYANKARCITQGKPIAIMTGGLPGSGKSTFINKYANWLNSPGIFKIDADEIRAKLPEYQGWNAYATHEETSDLTNRLLSLAGSSSCRYDVLFDGTMVNGRKYTELIDRLIAMNYDVYLIYIKIPLELSIERALGRYKRNGRYVPLEIIFQTASKGTTVFNDLKRKATGWIEYDNVSQTVTDSGGYDIPQNRDYTTLTSLINGVKKARIKNFKLPDY